MIIIPVLLLLACGFAVGYMHRNTEWYEHLIALTSPVQYQHINRRDMVRTSLALAIVYIWLPVGLLILGVGQHWIYYTSMAGVLLAYIFGGVLGWLFRAHLHQHKAEMISLVFVMPLVITLFSALTAF